MSSQDRKARLSTTIENIGGIDQRTFDTTQGITALIGANATNRTSALQGIMAAMGSNNASLKSDADEGHVTLEIDGKSATRTLKRSDSSISFSGEPFFSEPSDVQLAELYAFLLEDNEVRRTVESQGDLYDVLMRPVDKQEIEAKIESKTQELREVEAELERLDELSTSLPSLREKRESLENELSELENEKAELIEKREQAVKERKEVAEELNEADELIDELSSLQDQLSKTDSQLSSQRENLSKYENELESLGTRDFNPEKARDRIQDIRGKLTTLRNRRDELTQQKDKIAPLIEANAKLQRGMLDLDKLLGSELLAGIELSQGPLSEMEQKGSDSPTSQLLSDESEGEQVLTCGVCGSPTDPDTLKQLGSQFNDIRDHIDEQQSEISSEISELETEIKDLKGQIQDYESAKTQRSTLESRIEEYESKVKQLESDKEELEQEIETLRGELDEIDSGDEDDPRARVMELQEKIGEINSQIASKESEIQAANSEIDKAESELDDKTQYEETKESLTEEIADLRKLVRNKEEDLVDQFNEHMDQVLELLAYENLARIWIERKETTVREGRKKVDKTTFDLHVVRESDSGKAHEDTLEHLSESEREVAGLVVALTGYLVHDVAETVPVMLIDSVEMIDANRLAGVFEYFGQFPDYLIAAILPGHADSLESITQSVNQVDW